ncbi:hypothetical protein [Burkholderia multivorans]|uniref:hypothetical protein n=1 Tax=Burkholderia multivorans TaxID=87883 RepID=UPI0020B3A21D|nr:hypothetical protein [Burkholderia multivorans]
MYSVTGSNAQARDKLHGLVWLRSDFTVLVRLKHTSATFGLAFACMAAIVTAARTPYLTETAWAVAAFWILASIGSFITVRVSARRGALSILREELQRDVQAIKESLR